MTSPSVNDQDQKEVLTKICLKKLSDFTGQENQIFGHWIRTFDLITDTCNLNSDQKLKLLRIHLTKVAANVYWTLSREQRSTYDNLKSSLSSHFDSYSQKVALFQRFNTRIQGANESVSSYIEDMLFLRSILQISENTYMAALINGFKEDIKMFVISKQKPDDTVVGIYSHARLGEVLSEMNKVESRKDVEKITKGLDVKLNVARHISKSRCSKCQRVGHKKKNCRQNRPENIRCRFCKLRGKCSTDCPK